jgi:hypothetical protein
MKINVRQTTEGLSDVSVFLTESEANEIGQALRSRLEGEAGYRGPGYHLHIEDGEGSELTIGVLDSE